MVQQLGSKFKNALDKNALIKTKVTNVRKMVPWFNENLRDCKRVVSNCQWIWEKYKTEETWLAFKIERSKFRQSLKCARKEFVSKSILECYKDSKKLYKLALSLMGTMKENPLPECDTKEDPANQFAEFFITKIQNIRDKLDSLLVYNHKDSLPPKLPKFEPLTEEEVRQIIKVMPSKCCNLDVIPTSVLKEALELILPALTKLVNLSLEEGVFAEEWKMALVKPLLKKVGMDLINILYCPVSNLPFLSKVVEKSVLLRFNKHCDENNLLPGYQSAYRANLSCKTALLKLPMISCG